MTQRWAIAVLAVALIAVFFGVMAGTRLSPLSAGAEAPRSTPLKPLPDPAPMDAVVVKRASAIESGSGSNLLIRTVDGGGNPVDGVDIRIARQLEQLPIPESLLASTKTGGGGEATTPRAPIVAGDAIWVLASKEGWATDCSCRAVDEFRDAELVVAIEPLRELRVRVIGPDDQPIKGASVTAFGPNGQDGEQLLGEASTLLGSLVVRVATDAEGRCSLRLGERAPTQILATAEGFLPTALRFDAADLDLESKTIRLGELCVVAFRVIDASTGKPSARNLGGASCRWIIRHGWKHYSGLPGAPSVESLRAELLARIADLAVEYQFVARESPTFDDAVELRVAPEPGAPVVTHQLDPIPVGRFDAEDVLDIPSSVRDGDLGTIEVHFTAPDGSESMPPRQWLLRQPKMVGVRPLELPGGGARFVVPAGSYQVESVSAMFEGACFATTTVEVNPGAHRRVEIPLEDSAASVRAVAVDASGRKIRHWDLTAFLANGAMTTSWSVDSPEERVFRAIAPGRVTLASSLQGAADQFLEVELAPGRAHEVVFRVE